MNQTSQSAAQVPAIRHREAMQLAAAENALLLKQLQGLSDQDWQLPTDCTRWTVHDVVVHLIASAEGQASPVEFVRQVVAGRRFIQEINGEHWVDGLNEAQLRARTDWLPVTLPGLWERHSGAALRSRRRMPAPIRALPMLPIGTCLGVHIGWQPISYLFDVGFTRDVWMHRMDIARATGSEPELASEHDGRIVADIVAEWSRLHGRPYRLTLTGPAGGEFHQGTGGEEQTLDTVEFARVVSGRAEGPGILCHKLPL